MLFSPRLLKKDDFSEKRRCEISKLLLVAVKMTTVMKSKKNLTRFTYETAAFEGWRLCMSRSGTTFTKYFSDKVYGGGEESLAAAEKALAALRGHIDAAKRINGKLTRPTIAKGKKLLQSF